MPKILLAEDDVNLRYAYKRYLEKNGFEVIEVSNGQKALEALGKSAFDLVITDIMMPDVDGNSFLVKVREFNQHLPFLMLTALDGITDKEKSYNLGADDYLAKPFEMKELVLRANALIKRHNVTRVEKITLPHTTLDLKKHELRINDELIILTRKEFALLYKLLANPDVLFTREELMNEFWGLNSDSFDRTVDTHIAMIRKKCQSVDFAIKTVFGKGYKGVING